MEKCKKIYGDKALLIETKLEELWRGCSPWQHNEVQNPSKLTSLKWKTSQPNHTSLIKVNFKIMDFWSISLAHSITSQTKTMSPRMNLLWTKLVFSWYITYLANKQILGANTLAMILYATISKVIGCQQQMESINVFLGISLNLLPIKELWKVS